MGSSLGHSLRDSFASSAGASTRHCWICGDDSLVRVRGDNLPATLTSEDFKITDKQYGRMGALDRCANCGFHQCTDMTNVLQYYANMEDQQYELTRESRALQEREILHHIPASRLRGRLLDVGAGSGILIEQATKLGLEAIGVEPSIKLQTDALQHGFAVHLGVLPHIDIYGPFDIITIVDVIEHVPDPVNLLRQARELLAPDGILLVATPDRASLAARLMGWKWWHYRVAHIGYFDPPSLLATVDQSGFRLKALKRPSWRFPASYLFERVMSYGPRALQIKPPEILDRLIVPLNLRDSLLALCTLHE